jgi:hypothetical protein
MQDQSWWERPTTSQIDGVLKEDEGNCCFMFRKLHPTVNFMDIIISLKSKVMFPTPSKPKSIYKVGGGDNFLCIYAFSTQIHVYAVGTVLA